MIAKNCTLIKALACDRNTSVVEVAKILRDNKQRRILVLDSKKYPIGIISTTDMNNKVVAEDADASELKAEQIMTKPVAVVCDAKEDINKVYEKMLDKSSFFVPVTENNKLYGILTYGELLRRVKEIVRNGT
jgi:CBS domain-containing protein